MTINLRTMWDLPTSLCAIYYKNNFKFHQQFSAIKKDTSLSHSIYRQTEDNTLCNNWNGKCRCNSLDEMIAVLVMRAFISFSSMDSQGCHFSTLNKFCKLNGFIQLIRQHKKICIKLYIGCICYLSVL